MSIDTSQMGCGLSVCKPPSQERTLSGSRNQDARSRDENHRTDDWRDGNPLLLFRNSLYRSDIKHLFLLCESYVREGESKESNAD